MGLADKMAARQNSHLEISALDAILGNTTNPVDSTAVQEISVSELHSAEKHTFKLRIGTPEMESLIESIRHKGVVQPLIVRSRAKGGYEIIAGHTRKYAAEQAGLKTVPCIIHECSDTEAIELMAETNKQRENWLPSERAKTYQLWWDTVEKHQGERSDLTCGNSFHKFSSREEAGAYWGLTGKAFQLYLKLNDLTPWLLDVVDESRIAVASAYQLAFLTETEQRTVQQFLCKYPNYKLSNTAGKRIREAIEMDRYQGEATVELVERAVGLGKAEWKEPVVNLKLTPPPTTKKIRPSVLKKAMSDPALAENIWKLIEKWVDENK